MNATCKKRPDDLRPIIAPGKEPGLDDFAEERRLNASNYGLDNFEVIGVFIENTFIDLGSIGSGLNYPRFEGGGFSKKSQPNST